MTEDQLEQETLGWLAEAGYSHCYGLEIAPDGAQQLQSGAAGGATAGGDRPAESACTSRGSY